MISLELVQRYLGNVRGTDAYSLLGLTPETCTTARIEEALCDRLARTYATSQDGDGAELVRRALREAAAALRDPARRNEFAPPPSQPSSQPYQHRLTRFDREVLAILVASGGWNALSRARLVALAGSHGVTVQGLIKVISGLSEYARTGGPRLAMAQLVAAQPRLQDTTGMEPGALSQIAQVTQALIEKFTPELREQNALTTIKLSAFFGMLALVASVVVWYWIVSPMFEPGAAAPRAPERTVVLIPEVHGEESAADPAREEPPPREPIRFDRWPTFSVALPAEVHEARSHARELRDELDALSRALLVSDDPVDAVFHRWDAIVHDISGAWVVLDPSLRETIEQGIIDVLFIAADSLPTLDRLLRALQPIDMPLREPLEIWRSAWRVGMLAAIAESRLLPPAAVDQAGTQLRLALRRAELEQRGLNRPDAVRGAWLDAAISHMVRDWNNEHVFVQWECWLRARQEVASKEPLRQAIARAAGAVLRSQRDRSTDHPSVRVLGRLIESLDFAQSPATRSHVLALFDDAELDSESLHLLTSLLAQAENAPWYRDDLIVPPDADVRLRRRLADRVEAAWPDLSEIERRMHLVAAAIEVDSIALKEWKELLAQVERFDHRATDEGLMLALVLTARMNEAAVHLAEGAPGRAERAMVAVEALLEDEARARTGGRGTPTDPHGRGGGASHGIGASRTGPEDEAWARRYRDAGRDTEKRLELLQELRRRSGSDLSFEAASMFVREIYRGSPREVREQAHSILLDRFPTGQNVAMEMLDQFVDVPRTPVTGELVSRYTGHALPNVRSGQWRMQTRLALVHHAVHLHFPHDPAMDVLAHELMESINNQTAAIVEQPDGISQPTTAVVAAIQFYNAWRMRARTLDPPSRVVPGDPGSLARRHETRRNFARHSMHDFLAHQISVLEVLAYITVAEQPMLSGRAESLLAQAARARQEAAHVLEQTLITERAINALWRLRFDPEAEIHTFDEHAAAPQRSSAHAADRGTQSAEHRWLEQLSSLDPAEPEAYFTLAEDVADRAESPEETALAKRLFGLAGVLDPQQFGTGAALALAELEESDTQRNRLLALARLLDPAVLAASPELHAASWTFDDAAALEAAYALSAYRLGNARELRERLDGPAGTLLNRLDDALPGGTELLLEQVRNGRRGQRTATDLRLERLLRLEIALLSEGRRPWSGELQIHGREPLLEVDPMRLDEIFEVDPDRPFYRNGQWVERALPAAR